MKNITLVWLLSVSALLLGSCGALSSFSASAKDSAKLQERHDDLDKKLDELEKTLAAYGPIVEQFGPEFKAKYDKIQTGLEEGRAYLDGARKLHEEAVAKATGPDGKVDWLQYALLILGGGAGLYSERRRTVKERNRLHDRIDELSKMAREMERRAPPPAA